MSTGPSDGQLWYPRNYEGEQTIQVKLYDVRAASDLIVSYDFDRDGWVIRRTVEPEREVAFVHAWPEQESPSAEATNE